MRQGGLGIRIGSPVAAHLSQQVEAVGRIVRRVGVERVRSPSGFCSVDAVFGFC